MGICDRRSRVAYRVNDLDEVQVGLALLRVELHCIQLRGHFGYQLLFPTESHAQRCEIAITAGTPTAWPGKGQGKCQT